MAATYEPIATTTLGSAASSITFSSIPSTYTDLRVVLTTTATSAFYGKLTFNGDTGANYSETWIDGSGSAAASGRNSSNNWLYISQRQIQTGQPQLITTDIFSYAGSTYKTALETYNQDQNGSGWVGSQVGLWRSTAVITSITYTTSTSTFTAGTTATLYGIKAA